MKSRIKAFNCALTPGSPLAAVLRHIRGMNGFLMANHGLVCDPCSFRVLRSRSSDMRGDNQQLHNTCTSAKTAIPYLTPPNRTSRKPEMATSSHGRIISQQVSRID